MTIALFGQNIESIKRQSAKGKRQTPITNSQLLIEAGQHYSSGSNVFAMWDRIYDDDKIKENTFSDDRYFASEESSHLLFQKEGVTNSLLDYDTDDPYSIETLKSRNAIYAALDEMDGEQDGIIRHKNQSAFNITEDQFVNSNYSVKLEKNGFEIVGLDNGRYDSTETASSNNSSASADQLKDLEKRLGGESDISLGTLQNLYNNTSDPTEKAKVEKEILAVTGYKDMNQLNKVVDFASSYAQSHNNDWSCFEEDLANYCKTQGFESRPGDAVYTKLMREAENAKNGCISHDEIKNM